VCEQQQSRYVSRDGYGGKIGKKPIRLDPSTIMDARTVTWMATAGGAQVLGMEQRIGSLEVGKKADICIIDAHKPHLTPLYDEFSHLVYCALGADVDTVLINGKIVMEKRQLTTLDEEDIMAHVWELARRISRSLEER